MSIKGVNTVVQKGVMSNRKRKDSGQMKMRMHHLWTFQPEVFCEFLCIYLGLIRVLGQGPRGKGEVRQNWQISTRIDKRIQFSV